MDKLSA